MFVFFVSSKTQTNNGMLKKNLELQDCKTEKSVNLSSFPNKKRTISIRDNCFCGFHKVQDIQKFKAKTQPLKVYTKGQSNN